MQDYDNLSDMKMGSVANTEEPEKDSDGFTNSRFSGQFACVMLTQFLLINPFLTHCWHDVMSKIIFVHQMAAYHIGTLIYSLVFSLHLVSCSSSIEWKMPCRRCSFGSLIDKFWRNASDIDLTGNNFGRNKEKEGEEIGNFGQNIYSRFCGWKLLQVETFAGINFLASERFSDLNANIDLFSKIFE